MKINLKTCVLLGIVIFSFACKHHEELPPKGYYQQKNSEVFKDSLMLKQSGETYFPLDAETPLTSKSIQLFTEKNKRYFSLYNFFNTSVYIYDYDIKKLVKKIALSTRGPNGVGNPDYLVHYLINTDSLIIINQWDNKIFLLSDSGKVLAKYNLPMPGPNRPYVMPDARTNHPLQLINNRLYIIGNLFDLNVPDQSKIKNVFTFDLNTHLIKRFLPRPVLYNSGTFGGLQYELSGTYDASMEKLTYSFAADPYVYQTDLTGKIKSKTYLGSKYFKAIAAFSAKRYKNDNVDIPKLELQDHVTPRFGQIIFDPYKQLYYRFTLLPMTLADYRDPKKRDYQQESVIIADTNFRKVGEIILPKQKYKTNMFFVTSEGLFIALLPELQENSDKLKFEKFIIEKK